MGLTVHFKIVAPAACTSAQAKKLVYSMRGVASRFENEGMVKQVTPVSTDAKILSRYGCDWLILPLPGEPNTSTGVEILPEAGWLFLVNPGRDCEPLALGLCRYPATVLFQGRKLATKCAGWRLAGFSKTQFASLHGWEHFFRCHRAAIELLAEMRSLGLRVKISDEGEYWPRRSITSLRRNLDQMNGIVAAAAGALKDCNESGDGKSSVQSPIFAHKDFERLEAVGATRHATALKKLRKEMARVN